jgi:hypothetical protein
VRRLQARIVETKPGIPGCSSDAAGAALFRIGQMNVSADTMKSLLATLMAAYLGGKQVMIYYDNSNSFCYSSLVSIGGYSGQCP